MNGRKEYTGFSTCRDSFSYKATRLHQNCFKGKWYVTNIESNPYQVFLRMHFENISHIDQVEGIRCKCDKGYEGDMCKPKCWVGSPNEYSLLLKNCFNGFW